MLPTDLSTLINEFSASRSVSWFRSAFEDYLETISFAYGRTSFLSTLQISIIPIGTRADLLTKTVFEDMEMDPIEKRNLKTFLRSLETV